MRRQMTIKQSQLVEERDDSDLRSRDFALHKELPAIKIRRPSTTTPLNRLTRTLSSDSIDTVDRTAPRRSSWRKLTMQEQSQHLCVSLSNTSAPSSSPDNDESDTSSRSPQFKRSLGDLSTDSRTVSELTSLTAYQQRLLLQTWPNIYGTGLSGSFASNIFVNLCNRNSKAKELMQKANGVAMFAQNETDCSMMHAKMTLELLDSTIRNLDANADGLIAYLREIGCIHRNLRAQGLVTQVWDDFGDVMLESVRRHDSMRKHKELRRAWMALIAFVVDHLKQGQISRSLERQASEQAANQETTDNVGKSS